MQLSSEKSIKKRTPWVYPEKGEIAPIRPGTLSKREDELDPTDLASHKFTVKVPCQLDNRAPRGKIHLHCGLLHYRDLQA